MKFFSVFVLGLAIFFIVGTVVLADFTSTSFELENPINFLGGGESSSSSFQYISTIGQLVQGQNSSLNFAQDAGFLYFGDTSVTLPDPDSGGGGGNGAIVYDNFCGRIADLNCDGNINIFDLSILLYYLKHPDVFTALQDLKPDNKIDFSDLSVLFYYWD